MILPDPAQTLRQALRCDPPLVCPGFGFKIFEKPDFFLIVGFFVLLQANDFEQEGLQYFLESKYWKTFMPGLAPALRVAVRHLDAGCKLHEKLFESSVALNVFQS